MLASRSHKKERLVLRELLTWIQLDCLLNKVFQDKRHENLSFDVNGIHRVTSN